MIDRYIACPYASFAGSKYSAFNHFSYVEFVSNYYFTSNTVSENDQQPQELKDEVVEENHNFQNNYT